jgi:hypothetical protein
MRSLSYGLKSIALAAVLVTLSACAGLSNLLAPSALPLEQAAIGAAVFTAETASHATPVEQIARASQINKIAKAILAVDQSSNMALADVEIIVNAKVQALNLPPADLLVAELLTNALGQAVQAQLAVTTKGAVSPQTQVAIATVLGWIIADTGG